jgi:hypothetical protein
MGNVILFSPSGKWFDNFLKNAKYIHQTMQQLDTWAFILEK